MRAKIFLLLLVATLRSHAVIIDRIAIVAGNSIVKDSDIERDIRITEFLNGQPLKIDPAERKAAASRLLDQTFIRREIRIGDYPTATREQADKQFDTVKKQRFHTDAAFEETLRRYDLNELELRTQFEWQLTVLQFIDARFRPAAYVSEDEIAKYYGEHTATLRQKFPGKSSLTELHQDIQDILAGEKINQLFFSWLDDQRKNTKIRYFEQSLQ
jgi:hypothetical protein